MVVLAQGTGKVPVTGYQVVLTAAGQPATLIHPHAGPLVVTEPNQLALWCAGSEMLTEVTIRVHDGAAPDGHEPSSPGRPHEAAEEATWVVRDGGRLLAYADDYGATPIGDVEVPPGTWRLRATVSHRTEAAELDDRLSAADEANYDHPDDAPPSGPMAGPEVWRLDLWPE